MVSPIRFLPFLGIALLVMAPGATHAADPVMVKLQPQSHSGEPSTATLTAVTGQPVHKGTCATLDPKPTTGSRR